MPYDSHNKIFEPGPAGGVCRGLWGPLVSVSVSSWWVLRGFQVDGGVERCHYYLAFAAGRLNNSRSPRQRNVKSVLGS